MLRDAIILAGAMLSAPPSFAATIKITVDLSMGGEYLDCEKPWRRKEYGDCHLTKTLTVKKLPWSTSLGDYSLAIDKDGVFTWSYLYGDADAEASLTFQLPTKDGQPLASPAPYRLTLRGGDHASGSWQAEGTATLDVHP